MKSLMPNGTILIFFQAEYNFFLFSLDFEVKCDLGMVLRDSFMWQLHSPGKAECFATSV